MTLHKFSKLFLFSLLAVTLVSAQVCRVEQGCTGANTAVGARANLGLVIGTNVQAYSSALDSWAGKAVPSGTVVGTTDTQTLSSKTISAPIVTSPQINQIQDFNNNLSILLNPTANAVNGFVVTNAAAGGDVAIGAYGSSSNIGIQLVPKGTGKLDLGAVTALKISGTAGVVSIDGSGNVTTISPSGSGTVTSVGLSAPAIFSVSGSPVTTTGTLALSLANQSANLVWAGPTTGAAAAPTFRSLVAADIPTLDAAKIGTGQLAAARVLSTVTNSRCVRVDGSGNLTVAAIDCTTNAGDTIAPATNTDAYVPIWNGANSKTLANGYCVSTTGAANCIPRLDSGGNLVAGLGIFPGAISVGAGGGGTMSTFQSSGTVQAAIQARRTLDFGSGHIMDFANASGTTTLSYIAWDGSFSGNASTATALASSPSTCSAGQVIHGGITANGSPVGCNPINLASEVSGTLPAGNGGTGLSTYTSGGILYASASNTLASSGALTANAPVIGGGAGGAPTVGSRSGNTTTFATTSGVLTSGHCTQIDASGNIVDSGAACGGGGGSGTVTSVGLSLPTELTVSGSPVTTSGTLSATWANQSQRAFFAAPTSSSGTPSFRFLEAADIGSGTVSVTRGGTGAGSFSGSKCVESNAGGTALQSSAGPCLSGSGFVNYAAEFSGSTTNLGSRAYASTTAKSTSSVVKTGSNGETFAYDNGAQVFNVLSYGAFGDCAHDDTSAIRSAVAAAYASSAPTRIVKLPRGCYGVDAGADVGAIIIGSESTRTESSTNKPLIIEGDGYGESSSRRGATEIRYCSTSGTYCTANPGSLKHIIHIAGPTSGVVVRNLSLDPHGFSNVRAVQASHMFFSSFENVTIYQQANGPAFVLTTRAAAGISQYACYNQFRNVHITDPSTGGSGWYLTGDGLNGDHYDVPGGASAAGDSCSNTFVQVTGIHDGATANTYGMQLDGADNNIIMRGNFYSTVGDETTLGCGVKFQAFTNNSGFPHENSFYSVSAHAGVCGVTGTAHPNMFIDYKYGDCFKNCDPASSSNITGGTLPVVLTGDGYLQNMQAANLGTNEDAVNFTINNISGGQNGAGVLEWIRQGSTRFKFKAQYSDGMTFSVRNGEGSLTDKWRFHPDGYVQWLNRINASALPTCNSGAKGGMLMIEDYSGTPSYLGTVTTGSGGGSTLVLAVCNGSNWIAH